MRARLFVDDEARVTADSGDFEASEDSRDSEDSEDSDSSEDSGDSGDSEDSEDSEPSESEGSEGSEAAPIALTAERKARLDAARSALARIDRRSERLEQVAEAVLTPGSYVHAAADPMLVVVHVAVASRVLVEPVVDQCSPILVFADRLERHQVHRASELLGRFQLHARSFRSSADFGALTLPECTMLREGRLVVMSTADEFPDVRRFIAARGLRNVVMCLLGEVRPTFAHQLSADHDFSSRVRSKVHVVHLPRVVVIDD